MFASRRGKAFMKTPNRLFGILIIATALAVSAIPTSCRCQTVLYDQPSAATPSLVTAVGSLYPGPRTSDNFVLPVSAQITSVSWQGYCFNYVTGLFNQISPSGFNISIFANNGGQPGAQLFSTTIAGTANETPVTPPGLVSMYDYSVTLPGGFSAAGGNEYWISVAAELNSPPPDYWYWVTGTGGDGTCWGGAKAFDHDVTFSLLGTPVPEPASLLLVGVGCSILVFRRRN
jgi:hypothetical protein